MAAVDEVNEAWTNPGPRPAVHYAAQADLVRHWPALAHALNNLARETAVKAGAKRASRPKRDSGFEVTY